MMAGACEGVVITLMCCRRSSFCMSSRGFDWPSSCTITLSPADTTTPRLPAGPEPSVAVTMTRSPTLSVSSSPSMCTSSLSQDRCSARESLRVVARLRTVCLVGSV